MKSADRTAACVVSRLVVGPWDYRAVVLGAAVRVFDCFLKLIIFKEEKEKRKALARRRPIPQIPDYLN